MLAHLISCVNYPGIISFVISLLRVLTKRKLTQTVVWMSVGVWFHISNTGYVASPLSVWVPGILVVTVRFSGSVHGIDRISGLVVFPQLLQHVHGTVLFLILHMRHQVLRLVV